jgi:hypothetical protein
MVVFLGYRVHSLDFTEDRNTPLPRSSKQYPICINTCILSCVLCNPSHSCAFLVALLTRVVYSYV